MVEKGGKTEEGERVGSSALFCIVLVRVWVAISCLVCLVGLE